MSKSNRTNSKRAPESVRRDSQRDSKQRDQQRAAARRAKNTTTGRTR